MGSLAPQSVTLRDGRTAILRAPSLADAEAMLAFFRAVVRESDALMITPDEADRMTVEKERELIAAHLDSPDSLWLLAVSADEVVGGASFAPYRQQRMSHAGNFGISLRTAWRSVGLGTAMMAALCDWVDALGTVQKICLGVFADNQQAVRLYERFGFVQEGRLRRQIRRAEGDYMDEILMGRWSDGDSDLQRIPMPRGTR
jgi:RimJ/RimL family protein N-acetyltransferase